MEQGEGRANLFLSLSWDLHFPCHGTSWHLVLGPSNSGIYSWGPLVSQAFELGLNYTTSFPDSLACLRQIVGLLHNYLLISPNIYIAKIIYGYYYNYLEKQVVM